MAKFDIDAIINAAGCRELYDRASEKIKTEVAKYARDFSSREYIDSKLVEKITALKLQILTSGKNSTKTFPLDKKFKNLLAANRADLKNIDLRRVEIRDVNLGFAELDGADLRGATLDDVNLENAKLGGADLRGATLDNVNLGFAELSSADLREATLDDVNLEFAELDGADLRGATLDDVNLESAKLDGADLRGARLDGVTFEHTKLVDVDLREAELDDVNLEFTDFTWVKLYLEDIDGLIDEIGENKDNVSTERLVIFSQDENIVLAKLVYDLYSEQLSLKEAESNEKLHEFLTSKASELNLQTVTLEEVREQKPAKENPESSDGSKLVQEFIEAKRRLDPEGFQKLLVKLAKHLAQTGSREDTRVFLTALAEEQAKQQGVIADDKTPDGPSIIQNS